MDNDDIVKAAVELIGRAGADEFRFRVCEEDNPRICLAYARWGETWVAAGGMNPRTAVFRLAEEVIDGGTCVRCNRPAGFYGLIDEMPLSHAVCWYQYDPGARKFIRGCVK